MAGKYAVQEVNADRAYSFSVDYDRSVEDWVKAGRYDWVDHLINSRRFPARRTGLAHIEAKLIAKRTPCDFCQSGFYFAELRELLAFGEKYPEVQQAFPIFAFGSIWQDVDRSIYVPYLDADPERDRPRRYLHLALIEDARQKWKDVWDESFRFLIVCHKPKEQ